MSPVRTCRGCNKKFQKNLLIRWKINNQKDISQDTSSKHLGRGYYHCDNQKCKERAMILNKVKNFLKIDPKSNIKLIS